MLEVKAKVREWGRSLGIVLPKDAAMTESIRKNDTVNLLISKNGNALKETFGTFKFKRPTDEILKESDEEAWDE
ncbi:AbrB/MazE/SpoVT family DNA-binding domain-containing protein [Candidatus Woesearchaeota archaeon]|nr:AbrB/MazE/SpoVT family DNA-binding domain-containing protein [Candidatus Woesearchaeota archaeon]